MQARLTNEIRFPLVVLYFKTFLDVGAYGTKFGCYYRLYKKPIL